MYATPSQSGNASDPIRILRSRWAHLSGGAAWIGSIIVSFIELPPAAHIGFDPMVRIPQLLIAITFGVVLIAGNKWKRKKDARWWVVVSLVCAIAGFGSFLYYMDVRASSTALFDGTRYVIGELKTDLDAIDLRDACLSVQPQASDPEYTQLLDCAHGNPAIFWTQSSIVRNQREAVLLYIVTALFFVVALTSLLQALTTLTPKPTSFARSSPAR